MNDVRPSWDDLRIFLAIADQGSLAGAARRLRVNHSTVFRRLNAIEDDLKVRLFERLPRGYVLTAAGEEMTVAARRVEADVADIERQIVGREVQLRGSVRVTTTEALAEAYASSDEAAKARLRSPSTSSPATPGASSSPP